MFLHRNAKGQRFLPTAIMMSDDMTPYEYSRRSGTMEGSEKTSYESPITKRIMEGSSCSSEPLEKAWNLTIIVQLSYRFSKYLVAVPKERLPIPKGDPKPVKRKGLVAESTQQKIRKIVLFRLDNLCLKL